MKTKFPALDISERDRKTIRSLVNRFGRETLANYISTFDFEPPTKKGGHKQPKTTAAILAAIYYAGDWKSVKGCAESIHGALKFGYETKGRTPVDEMNPHAVEQSLHRILEEAATGSALEDYIKSWVPVVRGQLSDCLNRWKNSEKKENRPLEDNLHMPSMAIGWSKKTVKLSIRYYHEFRKLVGKINKPRA
jgi:hypothetical protein